MKDKIIRYGTMGSYLLLYVIVAIVSLISSIHFFNLAHQGWMSTVLACSFEIGQMACLFGALTRKKKGFDIVWVMFVILTIFQCMANTYAAYVGLTDYISWSELFGLTDMEPIDQKRIIAGISGAILPLIALGFVKCLTDYLNEDDTNHDPIDDTNHDPICNTIKTDEEIKKEEVINNEPPVIPDDTISDTISEPIKEEISDNKEVENKEVDTIDENSDTDEEDESDSESEEIVIEPLFEKKPNEFDGIVLSDEDLKKMEEIGKLGISSEKRDMQEALNELRGYSR